MKTITRNFECIQLSRGLGDLDDDKYDHLVGLYEKLQFATLEASDLAVDALTFASEACDFYLIIKTTQSRNYQLQNGKQEEVETSSTLTSKDVIGFVYLTYPQNRDDLPYKTSELNAGIVLDPRHQQKGYARRAINLLLSRAFKPHQCHRVQATIINPLSPAMYPAYKTFISAGFNQEGIRRRCHYNQFDAIWHDVAHLAILDTEWCIRHGSPKEKDTVTIWEELLDRHQMESEEFDKVETRIPSSKKFEAAPGRRKTQAMEYMTKEIRKAMVEWQLSE
ncbi:hypothetical protein F5887DRAFT_1102459 [Amanita rubescens]|nr:hypothetical protein F5887DRAFT_1102459 [Amanita rubescens]